MSLAYKNESVSLSLASHLDGIKRTLFALIGITARHDGRHDSPIRHRSWISVLDIELGVTTKMIPIGCHSSDERHHFADFALNSAAQVHVSCLSVTQFDLLDDDRAA